MKKLKFSGFGAVNKTYERVNPYLNTVYFFERSSGSKVTILENGGVHGRLNNFKGPG